MSSFMFFFTEIKMKASIEIAQAAQLLPILVAILGLKKR
jgi:hypothetical protein